MTITSEQKVGLFFLVTIIALAVMIELVEDWRPFETQLKYVAYFKSSVGLREGDPVRIAGVETGKVRGIAIEGDRVRVDFYVGDGAVVREDSVARIRQTNLLGGVFLGLDFGSASSADLPPGSVVRTEEGTNVDQLISSFDRNQNRVLQPLGDLIEDSRQPLANAVNRLENIVTKIDEGQGSLGMMINNPALYNEIVLLSQRMNSVLGKLEDGEGTIGKLMTEPDLYDNLNRTTLNLYELTEQIRTGEGTIGKLMTDPRLYDEATSALANLSDVTEKINNGQGTLGKLVHDDVLYENVRDSMARINSIATKIDEGQGTIGRLVNDDTLYRDAETTLHKVEKTVDGISDTGPLSALGVVLGTLF